MRVTVLKGFLWLFKNIYHPLCQVHQLAGTTTTRSTTVDSVSTAEPRTDPATTMQAESDTTPDPTTTMQAESDATADVTTAQTDVCNRFLSIFF